MKYPHSRLKAVAFLKSIARRTEIYPIMHNIHLLEQIIELGDSDDDDDVLFAVRTALEDFVQRDGAFADLLLKPNAFAILTNNIDWDVAHTFHEGHNLKKNIKAQEPGIRCIQRLITIDGARMMLFDKKIVDNLLNILAAFRDEPESGERLRLYSPKYDVLLVETFSELVKFDDSRKRIHDNKVLLKKLRRFITVPAPGSSPLAASP
ncbi:hypothetical protein EDD18DRAFT_1466503 [Armillaria luteobubalina]|uniref:Uncharacterized protein n=1 Tax=Armillaria luteobubalina TaxID=153913 RepID=A0AA39UQ54_9AGAR|nr:hypothetical protein EDD18DRAFT_1466503 [Armillaria luteobubalina]